MCDWLLYLDADGTQFGLFHARTVRDWIAGGYFPIGDGLPVRLPHWDNFVPIRSLSELLAKVVDAGPAVSQPDDDKFVPPFVLNPHAAPFIPAAPIPGPLCDLYAKGLSQVLHIRVLLGRGPLPIESVAHDVAQYLKVPFNLQAIDVPNVEAFLRMWPLHFKVISDHSRSMVSLV